jgi:hypothetical protein
MVHWCNKEHSQVPEPPIYVKNGRFTCLKYAHYGDSPYKAAPIRFFKFVWALPAGTDDPKNELVAKPPHYRCQPRESTGVLHPNRFPCLTAIAGQIIYYLTSGVPGG